MALVKTVNDLYFQVHKPFLKNHNVTKTKMPMEYLGIMSWVIENDFLTAHLAHQMYKLWLERWEFGVKDEWGDKGLTTFLAVWLVTFYPEYSRAINIS